MSKLRYFSVVTFLLFSFMILYLPFEDIKEEHRFDSDFRLTAQDSTWLKKLDFKLRFGINPTWPPIDYIDENGNHAGLVADYINLFAQKTGIRIEKFQSTTWSDHLNRFSKNEVDFIGSINFTAERESMMDFTDVFLVIPNFYVTNKEFKKSESELAKAHFALVKGYAYINEIEQRFPEAQFTFFDTDLNALFSTSLGMTDVCIFDLPTINYLLRSYPITNIEILNDAEYPWQLRMASSKSIPELSGLLNRFIQSLSVEQKEQLQSKYLSTSDLNPGAYLKKVLNVVLLSLIFLFLGIVIFYFYSRQLKQQVEERTKDLKKLNDQYSLTLNATTDSIFDLDLVNKVIRFENGMNELFESEFENPMLSLSEWKSYVHPDDQKQFIEKYDLLITGHARNWDCTFRFVAKNGTIKWLSLNSTIVYENAKAIRVYGAIKDNSEKILSQLALEKEKQNTEALINNTDDLIWSINKDFTLISANKKYFDTMKRVAGLDMKAGDSILPIFNVLPNDIRTVWFNHFQKGLLGESFKTEVFVPASQYSDEEWAELTFLPINENQEIVGVAMQYHNITEKTRQLKAIEKQNELLKEIAWTQSHVVRAPLARILTALSLFNEDESSLDKNTFLTIIHESAIELDKIITEITLKSESITDKNLL